MFWHKEKQMEFWFSEFHTPDVKHSIRVNKQLYSKQSDYQRIDILKRRSLAGCSHWTAM